MALTNKTKQELRKSFRSEGVVFAYLFGSRATGYANSESDYDIAVCFNKKAGEKDHLQARLKLIEKAGRILKTDNLDLVVINDIRSPVFKFAIIQDGKLIFSSDESARIDFELKTINEYHDYRPILDMYNQNLLQRRINRSP